MLSSDWKQAAGVEAVEDMIRKYDDFLLTLHAQDDKFEQLKRLTLIEKDFGTQRVTEVDR